MRYIEIRRHTMRHKPGKHLTQEGVDLARRIGNSMGEFSKVIASKSPRAFETALAMGYAPDDTARELFSMKNKAARQIANANTFADYDQAFRQHKALAKWAKGQAKYWGSVAKKLQEGSSALLVGHGGMIEAGAVAALPDADHASWGQGLGYCEGIRLAYDMNGFVSAEILRVQEAGEQKTEHAERERANA